ncbi:MAG: type IX secretion system membrane protein PorP/SprF [Flavobacteriaceae bacterium]|nr:type IX secretion system membrane protein PorP/SprF [Flavobacteriaceae bacterium]
MKKIISYIVLFVTSFVSAQELNSPTWTQYLADNNFIISPTYAGIGDNLKIRVNGLTQWVGIKDAPDNQAFYADVRLMNQSGLGLSLYNDKNGNTRQKGFKLSFAHHIILDYRSKQYLSFGLSYNLNNFRLAIENFTTTEETPYIDTSITDDRSFSNHNFDVGILYRWNRFYLSLSGNNILEKKITPVMGDEPQHLMNLQGYLGYVYSPNNNVEIEPSLYYQYYQSDRRSLTDLNLKYRKYNRDGDYYWLGMSYRYLNDQFLNPLNIGPMAGVMKGGFYFAYSYQFTINELSSFNSGTHSITLGINILQGLSNCDCTIGNNYREHKYNRSNRY